MGATHVDPPLPLSRLRAHGDLCEIRDLRFSVDDTTTLLRTMLGPQLTRDDGNRVYEWTEGWGAGVLLSALSAREHEDPIAFLSDLPANDRYLADFLWDEVLDRQSSEVRRFLVETAILDRFSAPLCTAVTQRDDAEQLLSDLERSNVFLVRLSGSDRWYRFHQVFRGVLARELATLDADDVADLHRRASEWYAAHAFFAEAIDHAIVAGDVHYAADHLFEHWNSLYSDGHGYTILGWLDRLEPKVVASDPGLCLLAAGLNRSLGRPKEAERWLGIVENDTRLERELPGFGHSTKAAASMIRSMLYLASGDIEGALTEARRAEAVADGQGSARSRRRSFSASFSSSRTTQSPRRACCETFSQTRRQPISTRGVVVPWPSSPTSRSTGMMPTRPFGWRARRSHAPRPTAWTSTRTPPFRTEHWASRCCVAAISTGQRSISSGPSHSHGVAGRAATSPWRSLNWVACAFARATARPPAMPWPVRVPCSPRRASRGSRVSTVSLLAHSARPDAGRVTWHPPTG